MSDEVTSGNQSSRRNLASVPPIESLPGPGGGVLVKVGGSLLDLPELRDRLRRLPLMLEQPMRLVVGGGSAADLIRRLQPVHQLGEADAHRVAIGTMDLNGQLVHALIDGAQGDFGVLPVADVLRDRGIELPSSWSVTSDSVAAAIAASLQWDLILAKSIPPPGSVDVAVARGDVDPYFPTASRPLAGQGRSIGWINLRTSDPVIVRFGQGRAPDSVPA